MMVEPLERRGPQVLIVRILEACNAGCFMCDFRNSVDPYRFKPADARDLVDQLASSAVKLVRFTGGEPLLHNDIEQLISIFHDAGFLTSIITNGAKLSEKAEAIGEAGLDEVIVSLDGPDERHDRFRHTAGLFAAAIHGLKEVRRLCPSVQRRVNTVVGPHNFRTLPAIYKLLHGLEIGRWSIIPLKQPAGSWPYNSREDLRAEMSALQTTAMLHPGVEVMGHGLQWAGRNDPELDDYISGRKVMTPRSATCRIPELVRYYVPKSSEFTGCNCVPHRVGETAVMVPWSGAAAFQNEPRQPNLTWLTENGPTHCKGCEPTNAAAGEVGFELSEGAIPF